MERTREKRVEMAVVQMSNGEIRNDLNDNIRGFGFCECVNHKRGIIWTKALSPQKDHWMVALNVREKCTKYSDEITAQHKCQQLIKMIHQKQVKAFHIVAYCEC